ncbi:MAG: S8 family serine peptidase [Actinomycetota bacterium]|nr:S8 family serine peptidase [Actinomycetota bacterium]
MRRALLFLLFGALSAGLFPAPVGAQIPPTPPRDEWHAYNDDSHWDSSRTHVRIDKTCAGLPKSKQAACSLDVFKRKPFVVIALVDTGINPYHEDFRAPEFVHHPSKYIEGYPNDANTFKLALDVADKKGYDAARKSDDVDWVGVKRSTLNWFPGTRIIGGISFGAGGDVCSGPPSGGLPVVDEPCENPYPDRVVIDDNGHGTGTASVAAGQFFGSNPNALIVAVEALGETSLNWATDQKWIDIVSNSWGTVANLPLFGDPSMTKDATERGQAIVFSAGNGASNTNSSRFWPPLPGEDPCKCKTPDSDQSVMDAWSGPSWQLTVGAISPINGQDHWWHSYPVDVSSFGSKWRAAGAFGTKIAADEDNIQTRDFGGTSCAAPITSGVLSRVILEAREILGDTVGGQRPDQAVAVGPKSRAPKDGPLSDGVLTLLEAEEIVQKTAFPVPADPERFTWDYAIRPTTPSYFVHQGYGLVDKTSLELALKVLAGKEPMPDRPDADAWIEATDALRDVIWN